MTTMKTRASGNGGAMPAPHDFSPAAIVARANAFVAEQAERLTDWPRRDDPRPAVEILDEIRREIERQDRSEVGAEGLPPPAPLPSLPSAFSRRAALFGAVSATGFLASAGVVAARGDAIAASPSLAPADARLVALADEVAALYGPRELLEDGDPAYEPAMLRECEIEREVAALPAVSLAGLEAKARVLLVPTVAEADTFGVGVSLARDLLRLQGRV